MLITKIFYKVVFSSDVIVPPFTSKVSKTLLLARCPEMEREFKSREPYKKYSISVIFHGEKPIINFKGKGMLRLRAGAPYTFTVSYIGEFPHSIIGAWEADIFGTKAVVQTMHVISQYIDRLMLPKSRYYTVNFITPVLLRIPGGEKPVYDLCPNPWLIYHSIAAHWNKYAPSQLKIPVKGSDIYSIWRKLKLVHHRLKIVDVYYGDKPFRSFIGTATYEISADLLDNVRRLFAYANYVGVGKSRSIGFGQVNIVAGEKQRF